MQQKNKKQKKQATVAGQVGSKRGGFGSRTKTEQRPASRGEETEEEEEEAAAAAGAEPWVEAGPAANGKLFHFTDIYKQKQIKPIRRKAHPRMHAQPDARGHLKHHRHLCPFKVLVCKTLGVALKGALNTKCTVAGARWPETRSMMYIFFYI